MTANARVHKHREKLRTEQCRRFEVWLAEGLIDDVRHLAKVTHRPTWYVVQEALQSHIAGHESLASSQTTTPST